MKSLTACTRPNRQTGRPACPAVLLLGLLLTTVASTPTSAAESLSRLEKALSVALTREDPEEAREIIGRIGVLDSPRAASLLVTVGSSTGNPEVYRACIEAPSGTESEEVVTTIARFLTARSPAQASLAAEMLMEIRAFPEKARTALIEAFLDLKRYPRTEAVQTLVLGWIRENSIHKWALRALIDMRGQLQKRRIEDGRLFHGVVEGLWEITGQEYDNMRDWEKYWETQAARPDWQPITPSVPAGGRSGRTVLARSVPSFFGREIRSARALFIIDVSGSMTAIDPEQPIEDEVEEVTDPAGRGRTAVKRGPRGRGGLRPDFGEPGQRTRIQRVKRQLYRMIEKYPVGRHFAVLSFSTDVGPLVAAQKRGSFYPVRMTERTRQEVLEQIPSLFANGYTRTDLAFEAAFRFDGINTIYLLSDGYPQKDPKLGTYPQARQLEITRKFMKEILAFVRKKNRIEGRHWEIHTLGFPRANLDDFLGTLARENHGEYSPVK
jgi:hypothetical protein